MSWRDGVVGVLDVADEDGLAVWEDLTDGLLVGVEGALISGVYGFCSGVVSRCDRMGGIVRCW